jgi:FOG: TPR repeat, SEL1 subfamily
MRAVLGLMASVFLGLVGPGVARGDPATLNASQPAPPMSPAIAAARGDFVAGRYVEALAILRPAAEAGDPVAQNVVGVAYDDGLGLCAGPCGGAGLVPAGGSSRRCAGADEPGPDAARRPPRYRGRCIRGAALDAIGLGPWLCAGQFGAGADGRTWLRRAGGHCAGDRAYTIGQRAADPWAMEYLGHLSLTGTGVPRDHARARELFGEAAEAGLAQSQNNLGYLLEMGMGGPADPVRAEALYRQAMEAGYARAGYNLAWLLNDAANDAVRAQEVAEYCDWAMARADVEEHEEWFPHCARLRKWVHLY